MRSPCRAFIDPVDVRPTGVAARPVAFGPIGLQPEARDDLEWPSPCPLRCGPLAVALFAVALFAVAFFAVVFFAVVFFAVVFLAVVFLAVVFLAVDFRATGFAGVLFAVVLVPLLFVGMATSLVTLTLGSTCLGDHRRRGYSVGDRGRSWISAAEAALFRIAPLPGSGRPQVPRLVFAALTPGRGVTPVTLRATYMENPDTRT